MPTPHASRRAQSIKWAIVLGYSLALAGAAWNVERHREWNFDLVGYVAAAIAPDEPDPLFLHIRTYGAVAEAAGQGVYEELAGGTEYRRQLGTSPTALGTQIRFYTNKPAYVLALRMLSSSDEGVVHTALHLSVAGYVTVGVVAFAWLSRLVPLPSAALISLLLLFSPPFATTARLSTPDMLSAAILIFASYLAIELELLWAAGALFALGCAVRPDSILAAVAVLAWVALTRWRSGPWLRTAAIAGILISVTASGLAVARGYPWGVVLKHTFDHRLFEPARMAERISTSAYVSALVSGFARKNSLDWTVVPLEALLSVFALLQGARHPLTGRSWVGVIGIAWVVLVAHYLTFPMLADRFFLTSYFLIAIAAAGIARGTWGPGASGARDVAPGVR